MATRRCSNSVESTIREKSVTDTLELGANFPSLKFAIHPLKTFRPLWADSWSESPSSCPTPPPEPKAARPKDAALALAAPEEEDHPQPPEQPAEPVRLPLPKLLPPYRGGGSYGGR